MPKRLQLVLVGAAAVGIASVVTAMTVGDSHAPSSVPDANAVARLPYPIQLTAYSALMPPEQLAYRSNAGVIGEVVAVSEARWSTPSGKAPDGWKPGEKLPQPEVIYRSVTIRVQSVLFGMAGSEISVALIGGSADGVEMKFDDNVSPQLAVGDQVVAFFIDPPDGWRLGSQNYGLIQGYKVKGGQAVASDGSSTPVDELATRARTESARRQAGATEPAE